MLADAFLALKKFDWGTDLSALDPIEEAVVASHGNAAAGRDLESRLIAALNENLSRDAHDYVCRKLAVVGTAAAVPGLAAMLTRKDQSHMARYALERINAAEAADALRDALGRVAGSLKVGVISSLGARSDRAAVPLLSELLGDGDPNVARAAALALGRIETVESASALKTAHQRGTGNQEAVIDALLSCAEALLSSNKPVARSIYESLSGRKQNRLVRLAATRGLLACAAHPG